MSKKSNYTYELPTQVFHISIFSYVEHSTSPIGTSTIGDTTKKGCQNSPDNLFLLYAFNFDIAISAAAIVASISVSLCAVDKKRPSNCEGGKNTPCSTISR